MLLIFYLGVLCKYYAIIMHKRIAIEDNIEGIGFNNFRSRDATALKLEYNATKSSCLFTWTSKKIKKLWSNESKGGNSSVLCRDGSAKNCVIRQLSDRNILWQMETIYELYASNIQF